MKNLNAQPCFSDGAPRRGKATFGSARYSAGTILLPLAVPFPKKSYVAIFFGSPIKCRGDCVLLFVWCPNAHEGHWKRGRNIDKFSFFLSPARAVPPFGGNCARGGKEIFSARGRGEGEEQTNFVEKIFRFHAFIVAFAALVLRDM